MELIKNKVLSFFTADEALWLPKGSIRAILVLILLGGCLYMIIIKVGVPEWFALLTGIAVRDYFSGGVWRDWIKNGNNNKPKEG